MDLPCTTDSLWDFFDLPGPLRAVNGTEREMELFGKVTICATWTMPLRKQYQKLTMGIGMADLPHFDLCCHGVKEVLQRIT